MNKLPQIAIPIEPDEFLQFRIAAAKRGLTVAAYGRVVIKEALEKDSQEETTKRDNGNSD